MFLCHLHLAFHFGRSMIFDHALCLTSHGHVPLKKGNQRNTMCESHVAAVLTRFLTTDAPMCLAIVTHSITRASWNIHGSLKLQAISIDV